MAITLRPSTPSDLPYVTALERRADNREHIGQWTDAEHLSAIHGEEGREQWIIERDGERAGFLIAYDNRASGTGIYVKRLLVDVKERGTGSAALTAYLEEAFGRGADAVWLIVRNANARAQSVYTKLGFMRFDPAGEEAALYDRVNEAPPDECFRMRLPITSRASRAR